MSHADSSDAGPHGRLQDAAAGAPRAEDGHPGGRRGDGRPGGARNALESARVAHASVYLPDDTGEALHLTGSAGKPGDQYGLTERYGLLESSLVTEAYRTAQAQWQDGAPSTARHGGAAATLCVLPLGPAPRPLGCLVVADDSGEGYDGERLALLELYADQVAALLEARALGPDTRSASALADLRVGAFTLLLNSGRIEADACALELVDIAPEYFDNRVETLLAHTVPDDLPALMSIVEPGQTASGAGRELEFRIRRPSGELRWLRLRGRVLPDGHGRPDKMLGVVAEALHLRPGADDVSRVQRLSATLATAVTVEDVSRAVVTALREPLDADRIALAELTGHRLTVIVLDPEDPDRWPEVWRSGWNTEWPDTLSEELPTLEVALREGRASIWAGGTVREPALAGMGPGGLAVLPLPADGRVIGACFVGWERPHDFGPDERALLTATAGLVGQALKRAHALDAEHELATMLQRSLLPRRLPQLPGGVAVARYLPAMMGLDVGGDWYDVIPLSERRVAFVIGDVQGHSAAAATLMGQMRTAIRAYAAEGHPPDIVVSHTNRLLVAMETDLFATCCYVELDMEEGDAWIVRAGHVQPLLRHPDGGTEEVMAEGGPPLGVTAGAEYPITTVDLSAGAVMLLMTDGLVESKRLELGRGMSHAREQLAVADPSSLERIADDLVGDTARREDDAALLLLRFDGMEVRPVRAGWTVWRLPDAVLHARRFTARTLRSWGLADEADVALLVVSELVTNALLHTQGAARLDLTLTVDRLRVAVGDASPRAPAKPVIPDWEATGGRGILLVEAVSAAWGSVPVSGGKQVWAEILVPRREPDER